MVGFADCCLVVSLAVADYGCGLLLLCCLVRMLCGLVVDCCWVATTVVGVYCCLVGVAAST